MDVANKKALEWLVVWAQFEYISHMTFILGAHISSQKTQRQDHCLVGEFRVEVKPTDHCALQATFVAHVVSLAADTSTPVDNDALTNVELDMVTDQDDVLSTL